MATSFFQTKNPLQLEKLSLSQNQTNPEIKNTRKPFFTKVKERSNKIIENLSHSRSQDTADKPINTQSDFINLREKVEKFQHAQDVELRLKFKGIFLTDKDPRNVMYMKVISQSVDLMFLEKKLTYRADFTEESSGSKVVMFFSYSSCESKTEIKIPIKYEDICYSLSLYSLKKDQWSETNLSSSAYGFLWKDGIPYSYVGLSGLGDFSKDTNANLAVVPVPGDDESNIVFLKFINGQFSWSEGPTVKWNDARPSDIIKFEKWSKEYNQKHNEN